MPVHPGKTAGLSRFQAECQDGRRAHLQPRITPRFDRGLIGA